MMNESSKWVASFLSDGVMSKGDKNEKRDLLIMEAWSGPSSLNLFASAGVVVIGGVRNMVMTLSFAEYVAGGEFKTGNFTLDEARVNEALENGNSVIEAALSERADIVSGLRSMSEAFAALSEAHELKSMTASGELSVSKKEQRI